mmetsp:Transcript_119895/g.238709  ORF Transcript_119895/g.238709 Transcript_119895/m.238709 type:complete len:170 (-) Transcript_119895:161-670(-)
MFSGGPPPNVTEMFSVKIDNLSPRTDKFELKEEFSKFGTVGDVFIPWDESRQPRSYGFVRFLDRHDAEEAVNSMDGKEFAGNELRCQMASSEKPMNTPVREDRGHRGRARDDRCDRYDRHRDRYDDSDDSRSRSRRRHRRRERDRRPRRRSDSHEEYEEPRSRRKHRRR